MLSSGSRHLSKPPAAIIVFVQKLILKNFQSPGDILMLTAAVRDLHEAHPGEFVTDVRTSCPALWENNPHLTPIADDDPEAEHIQCEYPLIHRSNQAPYHFIHGFIEFLNDRLGLRIKPNRFKGDIHISDEEKAWFSKVEEEKGSNTPFWLFASGGKYDYTIKWWDAKRYQEVVDHFRGRIEFVQVGALHHYHPPIEGAVDLRGQTNLRHLVRLMYHAQGAISAVSLLMHLAAAVETRPGHAAESSVRCDRRRTRASTLHGVSPPPVHPHRRRPPVLRQRGLLEITDAPPG